MSEASYKLDKKKLEKQQTENPQQKKRITPPNKRAWVSINLSGALIGIVATGIMSFVFAYDENIAGLHTWFGISFILLMGFHLRNNLRNLINYLRQDRGKRLAAITSLVSVVIITGVFLSLPPFSSLLDFGRDLRRSVTIEESSFQTLTTRLGDDGIAISIELRKGKYYESEAQPLFLGLTYTSIPQVAYWIEDLNGRYIDTLYVTKKTSNGSFVPTDDMFTTVSRPEALPYWAHQRGIRYGTDNQLMSPSPDNTDLDGMTGPTPLGNYDIRSAIATDLTQFRVMMEINRSYDFNDFYHKDKFPDDAVYSGSGSSGQPSVIYAAEVNLDDGQHAYFMRPIGHGHHSGANGSLYTDMQGIDTALELVQRVVVDI